MHPAAGPFIGGSLVVGGLSAFIAGFRALRIYRAVRDTPTARIRSMAMGLVEVNGTVQPRSAQCAPFSGRECAFWEVDIATLGSRSRAGTESWHVVHRKSSGQPFFLSDDTGVALVYPQGASVRTNFGVEEKTGGLGVPDLYMQYMEQHGLALRGVWAIGPMRFRERVLEPGQRVYALGRAWPRAMSRSISFDDDELAATGTDGIRPVRQLRSLDAEVRGVIRGGTGGEPFVISQDAESTVQMEYAVKAFGGVLAGPALTLFGLWWLLELAKSGQLFR